jgi:hypothetical protein
MVRCYPTLIAALLTSLSLHGQTQTQPKLPVPAGSASVSGARGADKSCALPGVPAARITEVVDAAQALQPPLAADALIRIAQNISAHCPALAKDLLQLAFDLSASVRVETAYTLGSGMGISTDSRIFQSSEADALQEDRLSLRSRVVLAAVPLDTKLAVDLFQRIGRPSPPASDCSSPLVPDVAVYYEALSKIYVLLRTRKPRNNAEAQAPLLLLQEVVTATTSPVQLPPLAKVLDTANLSQVELSSLMNTLAGTIDAFALDDNAFYARNQYPAVEARMAIEHLASTRQVSSFVLAHSVHDYLQRSLNGPHCEGNAPANLMELVALYRSLNRRPGNDDTDVEPFSLPTTLPPIEPPPDAGEYWLGPKTKQLLIDAKHLNFDDKWKPFTDADRNTPEWRDRVERLLDHIEDWHETDEADPRDYLHERCILLHRSLAYLPPGSLYNRMVSACLDTLAESTVQWDNPQEWDLEVHHFLDFARKDVKQPVPAAAIAALKDSSNTYLHGRGVVTEFLGREESDPSTHK